MSEETGFARVSKCYTSEVKKLYKQAKENYDPEIQQKKLEKLLLKMFLKATNMSMWWVNDDELHEFSKILDIIRRMKISKCHRFKQSTLNFEVLIEIIRMLVKNFFDDEQSIHEFLTNLLSIQETDFKAYGMSTDKMFVVVSQTKDVISRHMTFLK